MSNMNFNCDVCGREVYGCTFVNGMKFCAKCYQETFGETEKDRKIADLQSQLEEAELEAVRWQEHFEQAKLDYNCLKEELAEKGRQLKLAEELLIKQEKEYDEQLEKQAKIHYRHLKERNQDKISFCIEKLVNVQKYISDNAVYIEEESFGREINDFIDNQINELKRKVEDER